MMTVARLTVRRILILKWCYDYDYSYDCIECACPLGLRSPQETRAVLWNWIPFSDILKISKIFEFKMRSPLLISMNKAKTGKTKNSSGARHAHLLFVLLIFVVILVLIIVVLIIIFLIRIVNEAALAL